MDDIMVTLNEAASEGGMVGGMVEAIAESMGRVSKCVFVCVLIKNASVCYQSAQVVLNGFQVDTYSQP